MNFQRAIKNTLLFSGILASANLLAKPLVGVVVSMESEAQYVCAHNFSGCKNPLLKNYMVFYKGTFAGKPAVLSISGVGLVNSTLATSAMINNFHPNIITMLGSSGGINSRHQGNVIIGGKVFNVDFGTFSIKADAPTYPKGSHSDLYDPNNEKYDPLVLGTEKTPALQATAEKTVRHFTQHPLKAEIPGGTQPGVKIGVIGDSSVFYTPDNMTAELKKAGVDAIAFEDIGFLKTCWSLETTCVTIRAVSNALPVSKGNPPASASYAGQNAALVAQQYLRYYFK